MIDLLLQLPTWDMIRVAGIASFCLLTLGMAIGISYNFAFWPRGSKRRLYRFHSFCTVAGTAIGLLHGAFTVIDTYVPYSWFGLLVPFSSDYAPVWSGLGTLSGYGMLLIILTTDLRNKLKRPVWLIFHLLSYPVYLLALLHGFFLGSDSEMFGIRLLYGLSAALLLGLTTARKTMNTPAAGAPQVVILKPPGQRSADK
ncbi:ferric reductase-like transmembrane domain-containing protein [Paenibacillus sacheonensis]|uniref:Ferric reductase n=1 Tax=Paenibacillus sacheonensis TaxID=742054 RepID=A0A7X4YS37_9BACL|nr:ferric reductase-like transmembrane domain-containing protein [Paenibacillus sacheonensis]MBM7566644.1 putative ferric reductase [Paenibacillus sacheonensis]NBC70626.1 ferric reductase [Paenibacillus sacheonensis]